MDDRRPPTRPGAPFGAADELPRLLRKLAAPRGGAGDASGRPLGEGATALDALLDEIDETVMARRLVVANARGDRLALDVCNRRLLRAGPEGTSPAPGDTLTYAGLGDLAALRARLAGFCAAGGVRVRATRPHGAATLEQTGVAVATLRQAWARTGPLAPDGGPAPDDGPAAGEGATRSQPGPPAAPPFAPFCEAAAALATGAAVGTPDAEADRLGDPSVAGRLAALLPEARALLAGPGAALLHAPSAGPALLVASDGATAAAFLIPAESVAEALSLCRSAAAPAG